MNFDMPDSYIIYEFPLSNRIRNFLRYESLIDRLTQLIEDNSPLCALQILTELIELTRYNDIKSELLQNLQWQEQQLKVFSSSDSVNLTETENLIAEKSRIIDTIDSFVFPTKNYASNEFLNSVKLRLSVPGGVCSFDLPLLNAWLHLPPEKIRENLIEWSQPFNPLKEGIKSCLTLTRKSAEFQACIANDGFYNASFPEISRSYSVIRIALENQNLCYPEVSAGKQHFTIYIFNNPNGQDPNSHFEQAQTDIPLGIACCNL